jgi:hypothetical protein
VRAWPGPRPGRGGAGRSGGLAGWGHLLAQQLLAAGERVAMCRPSRARGSGRWRPDGRACYDKEPAEGKTGQKALRSLKRQVSNPIFACLQAGARRAAARAGGPGGEQGNDCAASVARSHPSRRLFGQATPGPAHHTPTAAGRPVPGPADAGGTAGHSPVAATLPPAQPQAQVERPQPSKDERPEGAARGGHTRPRGRPQAEVPQ